MRKSVLVGEIFVLWISSLLAQAETSLTIKQFQVGEDFACALFQNGSITCWGENHGLGEISEDESYLYKRKALHIVDLGEPAVQFASYFKHSCATLASGKAKCWGNNENFNLGIVDQKSRGSKTAEMGKNLPYVEIPDEEEVVQVEVGNQFSLALTRNRKSKITSVYQWGGLFGDPNQAPRAIATPVPTKLKFSGARQATYLDAGANFVCALFEDGSVTCWGQSSAGQLGQGDLKSIGYGGLEFQIEHLLPIDFGADENGKPLRVEKLAVGDIHACGVLHNGRVKCWGRSANGRLGVEGGDLGDNPNEMGNNLPYVELVKKGETIRDLFALPETTCAILYNGAARCWGFDYDAISTEEYSYDGGGNDEGEANVAAIGSPYGETKERSHTLALGPLTDVVQVRGNDRQICALVKPSSLTCWGVDLKGGLGLKLEVDEPLRLKTRSETYPRWIQFFEREGR